MSRARQSVPSTHAKRIEILFQPDAVDGIVAMCIEMSGSPKFEYHPSGSVVRFTPAEFRLYMENLRAAMRDRDLDQQDKIEAREAYSSAMEQYYRQEQAGGISIGAPNPLSDLSTAQTVGIVAAGAAALGIVGFFIWKSQQPAPGAALWNAFNSPGTAPPGVIQLTPAQMGTFQTSYNGLTRGLVWLGGMAPPMLPMANPGPAANLMWVYLTDSGVTPPNQPPPGQPHGTAGSWVMVAYPSLGQEMWTWFPSATYGNIVGGDGVTYPVYSSAAAAKTDASIVVTTASGQWAQSALPPGAGTSSYPPPPAGPPPGGVPGGQWFHPVLDYWVWGIPPVVVLPPDPPGTMYPG